VSGREDGASERSHEATPRRLERARQQGDLPRSTDAQALAAYLGFGAAAALGGGWASARLGGALVPFLDRPAEIGHLLTGPGAGAAVAEMAGQVGPLLLLFAGAPAAVILALLAAQRAIVVAPDRIKPKLARISPLENPTHFAVALKWERGGAAAPVCVAKGVDEIALAIRARAEAAGVPVQTDPPAARSLHAVVEVGQEIRPEHYQAVAAAIIFADQMRRKARGRSGRASGATGERR